MSGPTPSPPLGGDQNRGPTINIVNWTFTAVAVLCVVLRLFGRLRLTNNVGWDDFWIFVSILISITYSGLATAYVAAGGGRHPYYLGLPQSSKAVRLAVISNVPGIISVAVPKLAVACLLVRLLNPPISHKIFLYALTISCILTQSLCAIFLWVQCKPAAGLWNPTLNPVCWNPNVLIDFSIFAGSYSAFIDLFLALYPASVLFKLQLSLKKKIGLSCALGLGIIAAVVGVYKCSTLEELRNHADYTYATTNLEIVSSVEGTVIIIAACLPTLRPVFLFVTGMPGTRNSSKKTPTQSSDYQLQSYGQENKAAGRRARDPYPVDTTGVGDADSMEDRILPPENTIRKTYDVEVNHEQAPETGMPVSSSSAGRSTPGRKTPGRKTPATRGSVDQERPNEEAWPQLFDGRH